MCKGQSKRNLLLLTASGPFSVGINSYLVRTSGMGNMALYLPMIFIIILFLAERSGKVDILCFYKL